MLPVFANRRLPTHGALNTGVWALGQARKRCVVCGSHFATRRGPGRERLRCHGCSLASLSALRKRQKRMAAVARRVRREDS